MKALFSFFALFFLLNLSVQAQEKVNWMSMNEALQAQKEHPKKIIMDAYTVWCGPCRMMDKNTFGNPDVAHYINEHYYAVKFNAEGNDTIIYKNQEYTNPKYDPKRKNTRNYQHRLAQFLKVRAYPSILFFDEDAQLITPVVGYRKPRQIEVFLKMIAQNDYKEFKSDEDFEAYQKNFKPTFKN